VRKLTLAVVSAALLVTGCAGGPAVGNRAETPAPQATRQTTTTAPPTSFAIGSEQLSIPARTLAGATVELPTSVWYPVDTAQKFPIVVFSPGYQIAPDRYDVLTTAWAQAGFVVAEVDYPDTAPGSPPIESDMVNHPHELAQVISYLLSDDRFPHNQTVGVAGQSDGGDVSLAATYNTCCRDPRIKAAIILSGAEDSIFGGRYFTASGPPLLVAQGDEDTINPPGCSDLIFDQAPEPRYYLDIPDASHLSAYTAPAGPEVEEVNDVSISFLKGYLKGMTLTLGAGGEVAHLVAEHPDVPVRTGCPGAP
jgi:predicted dienelactone hydrolase